MTIDCNATLGGWPFRRLAHSTPRDFIELMDEHDIARAWAAPFEGILYKSAYEANEEFRGKLSGLEHRLTQIAVVNPTYPLWEDELSEYVDWGVGGLRVYPSYHGYGLDDPAFAALLEAAGRSSLPVQIVVRVQDERLHHPLAKVAPVELTGLATIAGQLPHLPLIVLCANNPEAQSLGGACPGNVYFDISHIEGIGGVGKLADQLGPERLLFGTHAPLLYLDSSVLKMREADLADEARDLILGGNAQRILGEGF